MAGRKIDVAGDRFKRGGGERPWAPNIAWGFSRARYDDYVRQSKLEENPREERLVTATANPFNANRPKISIADLEAAVGKEIGVSKWFTIDQPLITAFGELTQDEYFIHMDPVRAARETPFGGSIAHGFLTLSMLSACAYDALPEVEGRTMGMNYGFDKIRFLSPVPAGSRVRAHFVVADIQRKSPKELVMRYAVTVEIEGKPKPALAAEWLAIAFFG
jgi:acyl dehydratase